jgi:hypothetical protein
METLPAKLKLTRKSTMQYRKPLGFAAGGCHRNSEIMRWLRLQMLIGLMLLLSCASHPPNTGFNPDLIAKQEAARHGWKNVEVDPPRFRNGFWEVHVFMPPRTVGGRDAWVKITPEGEVVDFDINTM